MRLPLITSLTAAAALTLSAQAGEAVTYDVDGKTYEGYLAEATRDSKGLVILIHDWDGLDSYETTRAEMLADEGYDTFAVDLYGKDNRPDTTEAKKAEVGKLYNDREAMRARILGGIAKAREVSGETEAVVMGYCFGGGATLELARSGEGEDIAGYATFHGSLDTPEGQTYEAAGAPFLIMHGGADSGIPMSVASDLVTRLEDVGATYELQVYSGAPHAWTVFGSERYQALADEKSWDAFLGFLDRYLDSEAS
ncbi:dienelactone hydrolase family protein [Henriciella aquimarina]|uniref:dienelactone hydrolase family protein n=1 Tax=Henriciella aquimarina TaxID=545261 RepID=UPI000A076360|nr:dienelactone hydrolase family protein [Henriciella aquimarina]